MIAQGELGLTNTILAGANATINRATTVFTMRFRNDSAYTLTISRYSKKSNRTDVIYEYVLDAGDTVLDTSGYSLDHDDILYGRSDVAGTTYIVYIA